MDKQRQLDKCRQVSTEVDALFPFDKERDRWVRETGGHKKPVRPV